MTTVLAVARGSIFFFPWRLSVLFSNESRGPYVGTRYDMLEKSMKLKQKLLMHLILYQIIEDILLKKKKWRSLLPRSFQALEHRQVVSWLQDHHKCSLFWRKKWGAPQIDGNVFLLEPNFAPLVWSTFPRSRSTIGFQIQHITFKFT
jgi:hypothetical protein